VALIYDISFLLVLSWPLLQKRGEKYSKVKVTILFWGSITWQVRASDFRMADSRGTLRF
jgi:hypothetical protein